MRQLATLLKAGLPLSQALTLLSEGEKHPGWQALLQDLSLRILAGMPLSEALRRWRMVFDSSSMAGCVSAARAGLAVTVVAHSQCRDGLRVLAEPEGLSTLTLARFYACAGQGNVLATALGEGAQAAGVRRLQH